METVNAIARHWSIFMGTRMLDSTGALLLVGIVWALLRRRVSAQFGYGLFLLVLVKLAAPVQAPVPGQAGRFLRSQWSSGIVHRSGPAGLDPRPGEERHEESRAAAPFVAPREDRLPRIRHVAPSTTTVLMAAWGIVLVSLLGRFAYTEWTTLRAIKRSDSVDLSMAGISLDRLKETASLRRPIRVVAHPAVACPVVYGLWSPTLLIPADFTDQYGADQMRWILLHELAHVQRWDMAVKLFQRLVQFVFFFHPVVWIVNRMIDRQREFACDDTAVLGSNLSRADCGESFLHIVKHVSQARACMPGALGILSPTSVIRKRLMRILDSDRALRSRLSFGACMGLALIALLVIPFSVISRAAEKSPTALPTVEPTDATFPADSYQRKGEQYLWKQSLSANIEDVRTVLCLSHDGDITIQTHKDTTKNTVEVQATIVLTPRKDLADDPNMLKKMLALKEKVGVVLRRDDRKTPTSEDDTWTAQTVIPRNRPPDIGVQIRMDVFMPASLALKVVSADGDTKVKGPAGPVAITASDGDVSVSDCRNALTVRSADGDIAVADCGGPLDLKTADGDVNVRNCGKSVTVRSADGDIGLEAVPAGIDAKTNDGDIHVSFARDPTEDCSLESGDGDITIVLPKTANVTLNLKTGDGEVRLKAPGFEGQQTKRAVLGTLNKGGPALQAKSSDGDLSLKLE